VKSIRIHVYEYTERMFASNLSHQILCLILLDVEALIHEEAEEIEVWSPSYPRSLQTVWIGHNEQSVGQIRIHYSKPIAEILSSTHRAPWTRARMRTIQGHEAFENSQGHGGRHCSPLPQAMSIKNKGVLRVGVPSMQDLLEWAEQSQSSEDYKQLTLETFEAAPEWLAERRVNVKWKPLSVSSDMDRKNPICLRVRQINASPAVAPLSDVPKVAKSLYQLTNSIQKQHSLHLRPCVEGEIRFVCYTDQHDKLQAMLIQEKKKRRNRSRSDYRLDFGFLHRKHIITDGFRAGIQVVPGRQHNGQHLVWKYMHYKSCVVVAGKPHVRSTRGTKWE